MLTSRRGGSAPRQSCNLHQQIRARFETVGSDERYVHGGTHPDDFELREILSALGNVHGKAILDVGCGKGRTVAALAERGARVTGLDPVLSFVSQAAGYWRDSPLRASSPSLLVGESEWLPLACGSFDCVLCIEALEHVPNTAGAVAELARVLKPGGRLVVIDKNSHGLDRKWLVPVALKKWWLERRGCWMYPPDFPFREKWFRPSHLRRLLERHCTHVEVRFLVSGRMLVPPLFRVFPGLQQYVSWRATK